MSAFVGIRGRTIAAVQSGAGTSHCHLLVVADYSFPDGSTEPYVEISEPGRVDKTRVIALSTAVHALLNLGEIEIFQVGNRELATYDGVELLFPRNAYIGGDDPQEYELCIDCGGRLVSCTCQPNCPGGKCAVQCGGAL